MSVTAKFLENRARRPSFTSSSAVKSRPTAPKFCSAVEGKGSSIDTKGIILEHFIGSRREIEEGVARFWVLARFCDWVCRSRRREDPPTRGETGSIQEWNLSISGGGRGEVRMAKERNNDEDFSTMGDYQHPPRLLVDNEGAISRCGPFLGLGPSLGRCLYHRIDPPSGQICVEWAVDYIEALERYFINASSMATSVCEFYLVRLATPLVTSDASKPTPSTFFR